MIWGERYTMMHTLKGSFRITTAKCIVSLTMSLSHHSTQLSFRFNYLEFAAHAFYCASLLFLKPYLCLNVTIHAH